MIIVLKPQATREQTNSILSILEKDGFRHNYIEGANQTVIGIIGDTTKLDEDSFRTYDFIEDIKRVSEPYKLANRKMHPENSIYNIAGREVGEGTFNVIAGPCSIETEEQVIEIAKAVKKSGASFLRGGAFKPRTSPYAFQGLHGEGR